MKRIIVKALDAIFKYSQNAVMVNKQYKKEHINNFNAIVQQLNFSKSLIR